MSSKIFNFIKIEHTIFSLPLIFAGAYLGAGRQVPSLYILLLIMLAGIGARTFGMAMNRILDRQIDALNPRTKARELPSGKLSVEDAAGVAIFGFIIYIVACFLLGLFILMLSIIPLIALSGYSLLKRFTWLCHYGVGLALGLSPLGAFVAVRSDLNFTPEILLLSAFTFCWMSGYDIIYALQDIEFDKNNGIYSIPARFNETIANLVAGITHLVGFIFLFLLVLVLSPNILMWLALAVCGIIFVLSYLPSVPLQIRFFPLSAIIGILAAMIVFL
ncbi:4-hydroxybenzoate octaprenyltransferase [Candidatus Saganbacteria bacterium]|nr:4-hydroxybenzoate octaprenyltransferase [Candidatus Saganbacteria bacterium]